MAPQPSSMTKDTHIDERQVSPQRLYHPIQKDHVTFLRTTAETNGESLLYEVELGPHGGNALHRHLTLTETFEAVEGELHLHRDGQELILHPREIATVSSGVVHRFYSQSDQSIRFRIEFRPAGQLEQALRIAYGLTADGKAAKHGGPKNPLQLTLLFTMTETYMAAMPVWLQKAIFPPLAAIARSLSVDRSFGKYIGQNRTGGGIGDRR